MESDTKSVDPDDSPVKMEADSEESSIKTSAKSVNISETTETQGVDSENAGSNPTGENGGGAMDDDDDARPQATFKFEVVNFTQLTDSVLSEPTFVRNLPWKIMVMPRQLSSGTQGGEKGPSKCVGYFLQCNGESEASSWSCQAQAELRIINHKDPSQTFRRKISHLFYSKENDWGFSHFMQWTEVTDPEKGFLKDNVVTFEVKVTADAPHGVCWDSKKHTGFVGLKNQGATCYMNSLLQVLYFTNSLRKSVYKMPTEADDSTKSVGLALQRVFNDLQFSDKAVGTKKLTKSFGWETLDSFMQHDVQEFLRVLLDKLENKMKGTCVEGTIPRLFEGKMISFIRCKNVDYTSSRTESFYDIQLNIKGKKNIIESFRDYIKTENLDGENKYDAGPNHGLQDAEKGILFSSFPPVLHLHLMRFQYDPITDSSVKFNDRFEFPETLDLSEFIKHSEQDDHNAVQGAEAMEVDEAVMPSRQDCQYVLHAVLVHSGDNHGGHYVVFINPLGNGHWCKFDDDVVSRCTNEEAVQNNFGGAEGEDLTARQSTNAYMLVYIRKTCLKETLCPVTEIDIPQELSERLNAEKQLEIVKRKEKTESHLYMVVRILYEDSFYGHQGNDLYEADKVTFQEVRVKKQDTLRDVLKLFAVQTGHATERMRMWPLNHRTNQTLRPTLVDMEADINKPIFEVAESVNPWTVFLEICKPETPGTLPTFDKDQDVMLFFKYYEPAKEKIYYMGHMYVGITTKLSNIVPDLVKRANLPAGTALAIYEEIKPNMLEKVEDLDKPLEHVLEELMDGDILVFQKKTADANYRLPTCRDYFRDLFYKVDVTFVDKNNPNDVGFTLTLSQRTEYDQMVKAAAKYLELDPTYLQFFKTQSYREAPGHALRCTYDGTLKDLLVYFRPKQPKKMFYQKLAIPIHELENKKQIKCTYLSTDQKTEQELTLYPNKNGWISNLLDEAKQHLKVEGQLRLLELMSSKIFVIYRPDENIDHLTNTTQKSYRIEEIPPDQREISAEDEMLVPVAHYQKEPYSTFGHPFLLKVKEGESFDSVKERIQKFLDVSDKEFEKYRVSLVCMGRPRYLDEEQIKTVRLRDFSLTSSATTGGHATPDTKHSGNQHAKPFIGLQHQNKNSKRARYNYMEKAIKIYN